MDGEIKMALIETIIALALLYALLAVITSALKELIEAWAQKRKKDLKGAIEGLLSNTGAKAFLENPLIKSVNAVMGTADPAIAKAWPSYIDTKTFVQVAKALVAQFPDCALAKSLPDKASEAEITSFIETIYEQRMDRLIGNFKRNAQKWLFFLGLATAIAVDADSLRLFNTLGSDTTARSAIVALSEKLTNPEEAKKYCGIEVPSDRSVTDLVTCVQKAAPSVLGWSSVRKDQILTRWGFASALFGYLLTAIAISLGAPFWFDLINKVSNIRSTMKPKK